jgi:hypothetical protein
VTCPYCHSQRVSCPTTRRGDHMEIKAGPAACLKCGAHEIKTGPGGKLYTWVKSNHRED